MIGFCFFTLGNIFENQITLNEKLLIDIETLSHSTLEIAKVNEPANETFGLSIFIFEKPNIIIW